MMHNEANTVLPRRGTSRGRVSDLRRVQPPYAENRTSGGVGGTRGAIPVSPPDPAPRGPGHRASESRSAFHRAGGDARASDCTHTKHALNSRAPCH